MTEQFEEVLESTDWEDPEAREFALDHYEAEFAEALYLNEQPPSIAEFIATVAAPVPEIGEPEMPLEAQSELAARCLMAGMAIDSGCTEYEHYRYIFTAEHRQAARDRRARVKAASSRWRESEFADSEALEEMIDALNEIDAEKIGGDTNV